MSRQEFKEGEVKVLKTTKSNEKYGSVLRIANYIVNGKPTRKKLQKMGCYQKDGEWYVGKLQGLDAEDVKFIVDNYNEIEVELS